MAHVTAAGCHRNRETTTGSGVTARRLRVKRATAPRSCSRAISTRGSESMRLTCFSEFSRGALGSALGSSSSGILTTTGRRKGVRPARRCRCDPHQEPAARACGFALQGEKKLYRIGKGLNVARMDASLRNSPVARPPRDRTEQGGSRSASVTGRRYARRASAGRIFVARRASRRRCSRDGRRRFCSAARVCSPDPEGLYGLFNSQTSRHAASRLR